MIQKNRPERIRKLCLVLGDQLWLQNPALSNLDPTQDCVLMIEAPGEATAVWSHKQRIAVFLSAMRHFCNELHAAGLPVVYVRLDDRPEASFAERLQALLAELNPSQLHVCEPGEWAMRHGIEAICVAQSTALQIHRDTHFMCSADEFAAWAEGRKELRMEFFYREMRRKHGVLMDGKNPQGGQWNFDADNRRAYPKTGPGNITPPQRFSPDRITTEVLALVEHRFASHPGSTASFAWPVTREQGLTALQSFINTRLANFGDTQDAMWTNTPFGWHSLLSVALNLHLITPLEVVQAAERAYRERGLSLAAVEGFIRQVIGWREFIRGVYWLYPSLKTDNHYNHQRALPAWYWSGKTHMACMRDCVGQTLEHGYAHHIQRLMVTGQFALLAEIAPAQVADWYLAVYVDAVEWVELPNVAGMTLYANGGKFTSKPYIASGAYIKRQSNYCGQCKYNPEQRGGESACPVTTLYWNFLDKHQATLAANPRTSLMANSIRRLSEDERAAIRAHADKLLNGLDKL